MSQPEDWIDSHLPSIIAYPIKAVLTTIYVLAAVIFVIYMVAITVIVFVYKTPIQMHEFIEKFWK